MILAAAYSSALLGLDVLAVSVIPAAVFACIGSDGLLGGCSLYVTSLPLPLSPIATPTNADRAIPGRTDSAK